MNVQQTGPIVIYGGNGFVGTAVCEAAARQGYRCLSISRRGTMPVHLHKSACSWLRNIEWLQGDATAPDPLILKTASAIINVVGSAPLPTLTKAGFDHQLMMNGTSQLAVIAAAKLAGVKRLIIMGADIPHLLQKDFFAYYLGKKQALLAAQEFASASGELEAAVLQPAAIYGTRYTHNGTGIRLALAMAPLSRLQRLLPIAIQSLLPAPFVDVRQVARAAVELAITPCIADAESGWQGSVAGFRLVTNQQLLDWPVTDNC